MSKARSVFWELQPVTVNTFRIQAEDSRCSSSKSYFVCIECNFEWEEYAIYLGRKSARDYFARRETMSLSRRTLFHEDSVVMQTVYVTKSTGMAGITGAKLLRRLDVKVSSSENNFYAREMPFDYKTGFVKNF